MRILACLFALAFSLVTGCGGGASTEDCEKLHLHIIDLEASAAGGKALEGEDKKSLEAQKANLVSASKQDFMKMCKDDIPAELIACGLKAKIPHRIRRLPKRLTARVPRPCGARSLIHNVTSGPRTRRCEHRSAAYAVIREHPSAAATQ